jgi:DNA-binding LacI/PurR family transcriptional regulator
MAAEYLCEMGHREIGLMAGDQNHPEVWKNISAIKKVFQRQNISFNPDNLAIIKGAPDNKLRKIKDFINKRKVTAIYFINDILPQSLNSLAALNDISIIVSGNLGNCERYGITSIDTKIEEVCKTGVKLLSDKINGLKIKNNYILIEPEIIERGSVRKI